MADEHPPHAHHDPTDVPADAHASDGQDINVPLILTIGIISTILLVVIVIGTQAWFRYEQQLEYQQKVIQQRDPQLVELSNRAQSRLRGRIEPAIAEVARRYHTTPQAQRNALVPATPAAGADASGEAGTSGGASGDSAEAAEIDATTPAPPAIERE